VVSATDLHGCFVGFLDRHKKNVVQLSFKTEKKTQHERSDGGLKELSSSARTDT
jgi:hypothetical protein